jgi:hypothetical protein
MRASHSSCQRHARRTVAVGYARLEPDFCYLFTQVALESLEWAARASITTVLDNPNGISGTFAGYMTRNPHDGPARHFRGTPMTRWSSESNGNTFSPDEFGFRPDGRGARCCPIA